MRSRRRCEARLHWSMLLMLLAACVASHATGALAQDASNPCEIEVAPETQQRASDLVALANKELEGARYEQAAELFQRALELWDDPEIRLSLGIALFNAARPLDAHEHVRIGYLCRAELSSQSRRHYAKDLMGRLDRQLAAVTVRAPDADTEVLFNGVPWFHGRERRTATRMVYNGDYVLGARRDGYIKLERPFSVKAGQRADLAPNLVSVADATTVHRRVDRWKPWALAGAGVALVALGSGLHYQAGRDFDAFDKQWSERCNQPPRYLCEQGEAPELDSLLSRARWQNRIAVGSLAIGGPALATGLVLLVLNRSRESVDLSAGSVDLDIQPMLGPATVGLTTGISFR